MLYDKQLLRCINKSRESEFEDIGKMDQQHYRDTRIISYTKNQIRLWNLAKGRESQQYNIMGKKTSALRLYEMPYDHGML